MEIEANGIRQQFLEAGAGRPVVLLHGYTLDHSMWLHQTAALVRTHRVIAPDLRGFGGTPAGETTAITPELMADDVAALLDALSIREPILLIGLSMGGAVSMAFVRTYSARLRGLILLDTRATSDSGDGRAERLALAEEVDSSGSSRAALDTIYPRLMAPAGYERAELTEHLRAMAERAAPGAISAALRGLATRPSYLDDLSGIRVPTLIVVGELDVLTPPASAELMHERTPGSELAIIPGAGHMTPMEKPVEVNAAMLDFIKRHNL